MDGLSRAKEAMGQALEALTQNDGQMANEQFAIVTTLMLNTTNINEKRQIAKMAAAKLAEQGLPALQIPFQQVLARLAVNWTEAAEWVAAEGDVLAKQGDKAAATVRCCIARTLARDQNLPVSELVLGTLGVAGLCRDAAALGNMTLWQELMRSLKIPQNWFNMAFPPAGAPFFEYVYEEIYLPQLAEVLAQLQQAMNEGGDVSVKEEPSEKQSTTLLCHCREELQLANIHIGEQAWCGFIAGQGRLHYLGPMDLTEQLEQDKEIFRLATLGYTAGYTPEKGQGKEGVMAWVEHVLTKATAAGDFKPI